MKKKLIYLVLLLTCITFTACMEPNQVVVTDIFELESNITDTIEKVEGSCVAVLINDISGNQIGSGSGVIYKKEAKDDKTNTYYVVTNNHVVESAYSYKIFMKNLIFTKTYDAKLIGLDSENDLSVLSFESSADFKVSPLKNVDILKKGQFVIAIGTPLDVAFYNSVSLGVISNFTGPYIQHDAAINPGNSGGGLFNQYGRLIGINVAKRSNVDTVTGNISVEGIGFAIPITTVIKSVEIMEKGGSVIVRPVLGLTTTSFAGYRASYKDTEGYDDSFIPSNLSEGIVVVGVTPEGAAHKAGILLKDIILKIDNVSVSTSDKLREELFKHNAGDKIVISLLRDHQEISVNVTLK